MVDTSEGIEAVRLARVALEGAVHTRDDRDPAAQFRATRLPALFDTPRGVFVTLRRWPGGHLRGCIGYPAAHSPLRVAIPRVAAAAALEDPRFPPVQSGELSAITVEVSLLTVPEPLPGDTPEARLASVRPGHDGLIVERGGSNGLLLPQVAVEEHWSAQEFLEGTCEKAGLPPDAWRAPSTSIRRFQAEVFSETVPQRWLVRKEEGTPVAPEAPI